MGEFNEKQEKQFSQLEDLYNNIELVNAVRDVTIVATEEEMLEAYDEALENEEDWSIILYDVDFYSAAEILSPTIAAEMIKEHLGHYGQGSLFISTEGSGLLLLP